MRACRIPFAFAALLLLAAPVPSAAQAPAAGGGSVARRALDHVDYDIWNRVTGQQLSADGSWVLYGLTAEARDPRLHVRPVSGTGSASELERAEAGRFSHDGGFVAFRIKPAKDSVEAARRARVRQDRMPQDSLGVLDLTTGRIVHRAERLRSFAMPAKAGGWLAYQVTRPAAEGESDRRPEGAERPAREGAEPQEQEAGGRGGPRKEEGHPLLVRNLATGEERRIESVTEYAFSEDGRRLAYLVSTADGAADGAFLLEPESGRTITLLAGRGEYKEVVFDDGGAQVAFLTNRDDFEAALPSWTLYHWNGNSDEAAAVAAAGTAGVPAGWGVSEHRAPSFSPSGRRLFFGTAPAPAPEPEGAGNEVPEDRRVVVDVWHWQDPLLQTVQLRRAEQERRRSYQAVVHLRDARVVQLATDDVPDVTLAAGGDADFALGRSALPYQIESQWGEGGTDHYLIDMASGTAERVLEYARSNVSVSPGARYLAWFDGAERAWFTLDVRSHAVVNASEQVPHPVFNEIQDRPSPPGPYGSAGWTAGDERLLVYDAYDLWALDPSGRAAPRNVTEGAGRRAGVRLRYVDLEPDERAVDPAADLLLSAFDERTKAQGFYRDRVQGEDPPVRLIMDDRSFGTPRRAEEASTLLLTRGSFQEFPDLYVTDPGFGELRRVSDANPQQADYLWGTAQLVEWRGTHGDPLQGVLYKPEGFDPSREYPMMVYFYERLSQNLHSHYVPAAGGSSINISFYVSRGYLVFTPDIPYREGYPGESAMAAVVPGVLSLIERGFVDADRIGVQGHSWGGYQIAYMITRTNMFRAAEAGAPVSNMISAYGGIRWESGISRQVQYETGQSRIGGSLWERPMQFIENSPIFWADKVETPVLMMHNDEDGAVPWYQGIEFFVALRRLGRPVWMLNYNGEAHGLRRAANQKDWAVRMQQFFDHYLMDAPPPVWMAHGLPALQKGRDLGLDLVEPDRPATAAAATEPGGGG